VPYLIENTMHSSLRHTKNIYNSVILSNSYLLPSALTRGSESRIYSHKVCMYICGGSRSGMSRGMLLHTTGIGIGHMCVTQSDTLDSDRGRRRSFAMEMEVGDDGTAGPSRLGYYKHQTASPTANVTCHACPTCTRIYDAHT